MEGFVAWMTHKTRVADNPNRNHSKITPYFGVVGKERACIALRADFDF